MHQLRTVRSRILLGTCLSLAAALPVTAYAGDLTGSVTDASDTRALQGAQLRIVELGRVAEADRDGSFRFADVPAGTYTLEARYVGAEPRTQTISVPESGNLSVRVVLGTDDSILVLGQSATQASALSRQKAADGVESVLTRDAVGQFPDQNVAESLRRLPGVNILNDQGEGRFVSVRGLDPELNATSVNGVRLPAPESDVRSVALDVISSDSIESIEVKKSLTPDMDADTIGASIEIHTTSAFERRKNLLTAKVEGSYNDYSDKLTPKGSIDFAQRLSDNVGISGGISYYQRKFETDNVEADGWDVNDDGQITTEEVNYRDYDVERKRLSANLNFDFRVGSSTKLYARGIYSQFDDQEYRRETSLKLEDAGEITGTGADLVYSDADGEIGVQRSLKDRFERQRIRSLTLGGETDSNGWHAKYSVSYAKSTERENGSIDPANFERTFEDEGLELGLDFADPRRPRYTVGGSAGAIADFADPSQYELDSVQVTGLSASQDEEWGARFDLGREFVTDGGSFTVQAGAKGRWRDKSYNLETQYWEMDDLTMADLVGGQTYRITDISPVLGKKVVRQFFNANRDAFELNELDSLFDSTVEDYSVSEDVMAGYLLGRWDSATLRVIGGVRYEHTKNDIRANTVTLIEEGGELPDGSEAEDDTVISVPNQFKRNYDHWLPSLTVRWEPQQNLVLRAAGYKSLVRPKLSKLAPRFTIEQNDDNEREGEFGNPDLKPYEAWNFDAGVEYYLPNNGALSAGVFYKDVKNFIVDTNLEDAGTYDGIAYDEATIPINGDSAKIWGLELSYTQALRFLPAPFDGLLVNANYTYTDATGHVPIDGDIADLRKIRLPSASKHTFNAALGYEKGPVSLRLAGTYRSKYLDELGDDAPEDRIIDNHFQLDLSAKYDVTKQVQVFYEWVNINNAKYYAYNNVGARQNLLQFEQYKWTMKFGARVKF
ncbi:TonB-dependent receptor [Sphingopyxis macrogoltabida]|uniref:TonB-dependent receptor n=1 Tax=Sphingopyxis macrogoltabida TaxID=33050 RepID=A0AAC9ATZ6_SPHMC|nr:TonB-dependent receptor [Sphingopyxis macrogoltabida]ALJ11318.1 TonB-dependent receptor [Sphingopyxis macrogoltabida]AMU87515.1 TonB-dependent receptor [Sphingopyxis macrogoltabida]